MEGSWKISKENLRNERNAKSEDYLKTFSSLCFKLKATFTKNVQSLPGQHDMFLPEQRESLSCYGLLQQRRFEISPWK